MDAEMNGICRTSQRYLQIMNEILSIITVRRRRYKYPFPQKSTRNILHTETEKD
jgi:hypothetical protein